MPKTTTNPIIIDNPIISKWLNNKAKTENSSPQIIATTILQLWLNGEQNQGILSGVADPNIPISSFVQSPSLIDALNNITSILSTLLNKVNNLPNSQPYLPPNPNPTPSHTEPLSQEDIQFAEEIKQACINKAKELNIPPPTLHQLYSSNFNLDLNTSTDIPSLDKLNLTLANMLNQKKGKPPTS